MRALRWILGEAALIAALFLAALLLDQIALLKALDAALAAQPQPWLGIAIALAVIGWALLIVAWIQYAAVSSRPMTEEEAREFMQRQSGLRLQKTAFRGRAVGRATPIGEASFRDLKQAFRSGAWSRDPSWHVFAFGLLGGMCAMLGMFGAAFVVGPPLVKVLFGGAATYALLRVCISLWRA